MNTRKRYLILLIASVVLCAAIVAINATDYMKSKKLVKEDNISNSAYEYEYVSDRSPKQENIATININTATAQELADFLPGVGAKKAENIVAYRNAIGGFKSVEELIEVSGIGESTLDSIRSYCRVTDD